MSMLTVATYADIQDIIKNLEGKPLTVQQKLMLAGAKHAIEHNADFLVPLSGTTDEIVQMNAEAVILRKGR